MQDDSFREAARRLMLNEQAPTLRITNVDLTAYADSLLDRFANPTLQHRTANRYGRQSEAASAHAGWDPHAS